MIFNVLSFCAGAFTHMHGSERAHAPSYTLALHMFNLNQVGCRFVFLQNSHWHQMLHWKDDVEHTSGCVWVMTGAIIYCFKMKIVAVWLVLFEWSNLNKPLRFEESCNPLCNKIIYIFIYA